MNCQSYKEGHHTHYIATRKLRDADRVPAQIVHIEANAFAVTVGGTTTTMYTHNPEHLIERLKTAKPGDIWQVVDYEYFNINLEEGRAWFHLSTTNTPCTYPREEVAKTKNQMTPENYRNFLRSFGYNPKSPAWKAWEEKMLNRFQKKAPLAPVAVISGSKVRTDNKQRWSIHCYACDKTVSEFVLNPRDLDAELAEHRALHNTTE